MILFLVLAVNYQELCAVQRQGLRFDAVCVQHLLLHALHVGERHVPGPGQGLQLCHVLPGCRLLVSGCHRIASYTIFDFIVRTQPAVHVLPRVQATRQALRNPGQGGLLLYALWPISCFLRAGVFVLPDPRHRPRAGKPEDCHGQRGSGCRGCREDAALSNCCEKEGVHDIGRGRTPAHGP